VESVAPQREWTSGISISTWVALEFGIFLSRGRLLSLNGWARAEIGCVKRDTIGPVGPLPGKLSALQADTSIER
jgi:hypothetical protein